MDWLSWSNAAYLGAILVGGYITIAAARYKKILKEIQEALNAYHSASEDGEITEEERDLIVKEVLDIASAGIRVFWWKR